jgi:hypothetical protein
LSVITEDLQKIQETPCLFCRNTVRYIIDFSLSVASPRSEADPRVPAVRGTRKAKAS